MSIIQKVLIVDDVHQILVFGLISNNFDVFYLPDIQANEIADFIVNENIELINNKYRQKTCSSV